MSEHVHLYDLQVVGEDPDFVTTWTCRCRETIVKTGLPSSREGVDLTIKPGRLDRGES